MSDCVRPDFTHLPHLMDVLNLALDSWEAAREQCGPEVAGDPVRDMATAAILAGYQRVTI
jgi:hypothetical protein